MSEHQCILKIQTRGGPTASVSATLSRTTFLFFSLPNTQLCSEMFKVVMSTFSSPPLALIDGPVWWRAAGGFLVALILTVAVRWGVCNTRAAGRCGGTRGGFGFDLQPLFTQSLSKVVVNRDTDGELGAGLLVVQPQASLEVLLHHMVIVAFGIHWKTSSKWHQPHTFRVRTNEKWTWTTGAGATHWPDGCPLWTSDMQDVFLNDETQVITEGRTCKSRPVSASDLFVPTSPHNCTGLYPIFDPCKISLGKNGIIGKIQQILPNSEEISDHMELLWFNVSLIIGFKWTFGLRAQSWLYI